MKYFITHTYIAVQRDYRNNEEEHINNTQYGTIPRPKSKVLNHV